MNRRLAVTLLGLSVLLSTIARADDEENAPKPSADEALQKLAELGPGVHKIKTDEKGRIVSCIVVGQARVSTVLGKAKGLEAARNKANLAASAQFVKWLKEEVNVYESSDTEDVILIEGSEEGDEDSLKESGKSVEKASVKMESISKGLVRGLQLIHKEVDGDGRTYTVVKGWKSSTADATKKVAADLADDEPADEDGSRKPVKKAKKIDKDIDDESVTSDDAADFLD